MPLGGLLDQFGRPANYTPATPAPATTPAAGTTAAAPSSAPPTAPAALTSDQQNEQAQLSQVLEAAGLSALEPQVLDWIKQGYDSTSIQALFTNPKAYSDPSLYQVWQTRFAGNAARTKAGLPALSPGDYIALEAQYKTLGRQYGLPDGFLDKTMSDSLIGGDVKADELQSRLNEYSTLLYSEDQNTRDAFTAYTGTDMGHALAYLIDPQKALPIIQQKMLQAQIGGAAARQGLGMLGQTDAARLAGAGVTAQQASSGFGQIAGVLPAEQDIAQRYGQTYTQGQAEDEFLLNSGTASAQRAALNRQEAAQFQASGAVGDNLYKPTYGLASESGGQF